MPPKNKRPRNGRPRRLMAPQRTPSQQSEYKFVRYMNVANAGGTSVDGGTLVKSTNLSYSTGSSALAITYGTMSFAVSLADLPDYSDFTALFDQYRVDSVELILQPYCTNVTTGAAYLASTGQSGILVHSVVDYDDSTLPAGSDAGIQALREYQNYRVESLFNGEARPLTRTFVPRVATPVYSGVSFTSYRNSPFDWMDCGYPSVAGYGWKGVLEGVSSGITSTFLIKAEAKVTLRFRNVR